MKIKDLLTIIIPCKNEKDLISFTLGLLNKQINIQGTRVIICDSSDDDTRNIILKEKYDNLNIEIIDGGFPAKARNNGAVLSETKYILFLDADMFLKDANTIESSLKHITQYSLSLVTAKFRTKGKYFYVFPVFEFIRDWFSYHSVCAVGGFMLFDREVFLELGGFDPTYLFAEDYALSSKINHNDFSVINKKIYTTDRRFRKKGLFYMTKMMVLSFLNSDNPKFFQNHHNYWV
jgi:glycosyltransferase involved in cell wall biosynthesis